MCKREYCRCARCGHVHCWDDICRDPNGGGDRGETAAVCPDCYCADLEDVEQCCECREWKSLDSWNLELYGKYSGECRCKDCLAKHANFKNAVNLGREYETIEVSGFFDRFFDSPADIERVLMDYVSKHTWPERVSEESYLYCMDDLDSFAEFLAKEDART